MNASPNTTTTKPVISCCEVDESSPPAAATPVPSATNTAVKPRTNGMLETTTWREALRPGQEAHESESEDDDDEAGDLLLRGRGEQPARSGDAGPERDEDGREAEDERDARDDDLARRAPLGEARWIDGRDRREVPGDERQDARREERHEPRCEGNGDLPQHQCPAQQ